MNPTSNIEPREDHHGRRTMKTPIFVLAVVCLWTMPFARAQPPLHVIRPTSRIHVILAGDTNDAQIGRSAEVDLRNLETLFLQLLPIEGQVQIRTLRGQDVSKTSILHAIAGCQPGPDDALVFVWSGRGAQNRMGDFFYLPGGDALYRSDVVAAMQRRHPRLVVLLSNCWNQESDALFRRVYERHYSIYPNFHDNPDTIAPIADELFLKPHGLVDISGSSEMQLVLANPERGSCLLRPLVDYVRHNSGRRVSWPTLVGDVSSLAEIVVEEVHPNGNLHEASRNLYTEETLKVSSLPNDTRGPRLGVAATDNNGDGVRVLDVWANYPATRAVCLSSGERCVLEPNDVILSINGQPVRCLQDFDRAVKLSPQQIILTVRNWRDGQVGFLAVTLRY